MLRDLPKNYDPAAIEGRIYTMWEEAGCFAPQGSAAQPYAVTIPPPNVTGELHMGHALQHTIHDILIRLRRMEGFAALCLPGTDHAGISTNIKVDQALRSEGSDRWTAGRDRFIERGREWTLKYGGAILTQLRSLGCSYDWDRTRFTLDEFVEYGPETAGWALGRLYTRSGYARAVLEAFVRFYRRGWIYRDERIVNWCPQCRTTLSELELEYRDVAGSLWRIRYPGASGGEGLVVATTRPETMLGDTGVAVSPSDQRYAGLIGTELELPLTGRRIPVVADHHVDASFGTGAVKVTPAHDPNDWEIAGRHPELLPAISVMDDRGVMTAAAGAFEGLSREEARARVIEALQERGLLEGRDEHPHSVAHHDKCGTLVEPLLKLQWWARCDEMAEAARRAIEDRRVTFVPDRFTQMATGWLESIRPWCISRQLWWGHRIPLYYCLDCDPAVRSEPGPEGTLLLQIDPGARPIVSVEPPAACEACGSSRIQQDPDVLDTWFSSALWPHATLGWPEQEGDLRRFYPTDLMITGRDILYLWVARMIMTGLEFTGDVPFRQVLIHASVLTEDGRRMSKSLGTGVDPLEVVRLYGADATRLGLASLVSESQDIRFKMTWQSGGRAAASPDDSLAKAEQIEQMRNFCTKLWNLSRFVLMNLQPGEELHRPENLPALLGDSIELADRWILSRLAACAEEMEAALSSYSIGEAVWRLYHFVWDELADWYVELVKPRLRGEKAEAARAVLQSVLETALRLAHPFIPFITEELWQALPGTPEGARLIEQAYPAGMTALRAPEVDTSMARMIDLARGIRALKAELGIPGRPAGLYLAASDDIPVDYLLMATRSTLLPARPDGMTAGDAAAGVEFVLGLDGLIDLDAERARLDRDAAALEKEISSLDGRLMNPQFRERAPAEVVEKQAAARAEAAARLELIRRRRRMFS